jgi:hypothetical protein
MMKGRPFSFLDHAIKCGNSLLGVSSIKQIESFRLRPGNGQITFATTNLLEIVKEASAKRRLLETLPSNDHIQIETKTRLHVEAEASINKIKTLADCLIAFELGSKSGKSDEAERDAAALGAQIAMAKTPLEFQSYSKSQMVDVTSRPFHWPLEFPEVVEQGGFNCVIGNPPFISYYVRERSDTEFMKRLASCYSFSYDRLATKRYSSAMFFWERAINQTLPEGTIGFLNGNLRVTRSMIVNKCTLIAVVENIRAFANVVSGQVFIAVRSRPISCGAQQYLFLNNWEKPTILTQADVSSDDNYHFGVRSVSALAGRQLKQIYEVRSGVNLGGAREAFLTEGLECDLSKPFVSSGAIKSKLQATINASAFITYSQDLCAQVNENFKERGNKSIAVLGPLGRFEKPKLIVRQSAPEIVVSVDESGLVCSQSYFVISPSGSHQYDIYYLAGILSSDAITEYAISNQVIKMAAGKQPQIRKAALDSLPIPTPQDKQLISLVRETVKSIISENDSTNRAELFLTLENLVSECYRKHSESMD